MQVEEFPYPNAIVRADFQVNDFTPDEFLFSSHRFTSIDVLIKDLGTLYRELQDELVNIVNEDYTDFIKLGRSIEGGMDHINTMVTELKQFQKLCRNSEVNLSNSNEAIVKSLKQKEQLIKIKNNVKLCVLLLSQIEMFENLLNPVGAGEDQEEEIIPKLKRLTTLYLSLNKLYGVLHKMEIPYITGLNKKVLNIGLEYRNYLNEVLRKYKHHREDYKLIVFEMMRIYSVIGHSDEFIKEMNE